MKLRGEVLTLEQALKVAIELNRCLYLCLYLLLTTELLNYPAIYKGLATVS